MRRPVLAVAAIAVPILIATLVIPGSPVRKLAHQVRRMECFQRPRDGGVAAVGDSITAGTTNAGLGLLGEDSWLSQDVCGRHIAYSYNAAVPLQTTAQIEASLPKALAHHPDVVVILAGTNDLEQHLSVTAAVRRIDAMAAGVEAHRARPVLATVPPLATQPRAAAALNTELRHLARDRHLLLIDFHRVLASGDRYKPGLSADGVHPTVAGAKLMAAVAQPILSRALAH